MWTCPKCSEENKDIFASSPKCGAEASPQPQFDPSYRGLLRAAIALTVPVALVLFVSIVADLPTKRDISETTVYIILFGTLPLLTISLVAIIVIVCGFVRVLDRTREPVILIICFGIIVWHWVRFISILRYFQERFMT